jgi:hypothetical protein
VIDVVAESLGCDNGVAAKKAHGEETGLGISRDV